MSILKTLLLTAFALAQTINAAGAADPPVETPACTGIPCGTLCCTPGAELCGADMKCAPAPATTSGGSPGATSIEGTLTIQTSTPVSSAATEPVSTATETTTGESTPSASITVTVPQTHTLVSTVHMNSTTVTETVTKMSTTSGAASGATSSGSGSGSGSNSASASSTSAPNAGDSVRFGGGMGSLAAAAVLLAMGAVLGMV